MNELNLTVADVMLTVARAEAAQKDLYTAMMSLRDSFEGIEKDERVSIRIMYKEYMALEESINKVRVTNINDHHLLYKRVIDLNGFCSNLKGEPQD